MLQTIKDYLRVSWDYDNAMLTDLIAQGQAYLNAHVGVQLTYDEPGLPQSLLFDWVRYAYNNATEYFEENFRQDLRLLKWTVAAREAGEAEDED